LGSWNLARVAKPSSALGRRADSVEPQHLRESEVVAAEKFSLEFGMRLF